MEHLEMIISYEDLEKNRRKHLLEDKKRKANNRKTKIINGLGIILFYSLIVFGVIGLNARFEQINGQTKSTNEPPTQIVQNNQR